MVFGTKYDIKLTEELVAAGWWPCGSLIKFDGALWFVIGYKRWSEIMDFETLEETNPEFFYDAVLFHIKSGMTANMPIVSLIDGGMKCSKLEI